MKRVRKKHYSVKITREREREKIRVSLQLLLLKPSNNKFFGFSLNFAYYRAKHMPVFFRGIGGAILFLMLCAAIYEYKTTPSDKDAESLSVSNNNERLSNFSNKNLNQDHGVVQENGEELIEKGKNLQKDLPDHSKKNKKGKIRGRSVIFPLLFCNLFFLLRDFSSRFRLLDNVSDSV